MSDTTKKTAEPKKTTAKKSAPTPLTATTPSNDEFDAIFGGGTEKKAAAPQKAKTVPKEVTGNVTAAPNDAFDAIFGKGK